MTKNLVGTEPAPLENDLEKAYSIGLYDFQSVQCNLDEQPAVNAVRSVIDATQETPTKIGKDEKRSCHEEQESTEAVPTRLKDAENEFSDYERISFSLSYSTEEVNPPISTDNCMDQNEGSFFSNIKKEQDDPKQKKSSVLRELKEKLKGHSMKNDTENLLIRRTYVEKLSNVPEFISTLTAQNPDGLEMIIPAIRSRHLSLLNIQDGLLSNENISTNTDNKDQQEFVAMPVKADYLDLNFLKLKESDYINPLEIGENGRYKDEEDLFCENLYPKYEDLLKKPTFEYTPCFTIKSATNQLYVGSSASDTAVPSEKSSSDGEVQCSCSASNAELHHCKSPLKKLPTRNDIRGRAIRQKKTYFNNVMTYYLNKDALLNDSTSSNTSNK